jgi:hypothetical protein
LILIFEINRWFHFIKKFHRYYWIFSLKSRLLFQNFIANNFTVLIIHLFKRNKNHNTVNQKWISVISKVISFFILILQFSRKIWISKISMDITLIDDLKYSQKRYPSDQLFVEFFI